MIPIYSLEEAKRTILIRKSLVDIVPSPQINDQIVKLFGKALTLQEVVKRIINDVIKTGDLALIEWTKKLDNNDISNSIEVKVDQMEEAQYNIDPKIKEGTNQLVIPSINPGTIQIDKWVYRFFFSCEKYKIVII